MFPVEMCLVFPPNSDALDHLQSRVPVCDWRITGAMRKCHIDTIIWVKGSTKRIERERERASERAGLLESGIKRDHAEDLKPQGSSRVSNRKAH